LNGAYFMFILNFGQALFINICLNV
jgi:hypothetical protein